jgi:hypothetical protein
MVLVNIIQKESQSFFTYDCHITWHKMRIFVNRSITTKIESKALELGRSVIKSIDIEDQGFFGIGSGSSYCMNDNEEPWNGNVCHML